MNALYKLGVRVDRRRSRWFVQGRGYVCAASRFLATQHTATIWRLTMSRSRAQRLAIVGILGASACLTGCGLGLAGIDASTTIPDALNQLAQAAAADPTLSQLTVGDVVQGFQQYIQQFTSGTAAYLGSTPELTTDQQTQLQNLQGQLDRGEITQQEFAQQVQAVIGDAAAGRAFAGMDMLGGPFPVNPCLASPTSFSSPMRNASKRRTFSRACMTTSRHYAKAPWTRSRRCSPRINSHSSRRLKRRRRPAAGPTVGPWGRRRIQMPYRRTPTPHRRICMRRRPLWIRTRPSTPGWMGGLRSPTRFN